MMQTNTITKPMSHEPLIGRLPESQRKYFWRRMGAMALATLVAVGAVKGVPALLDRADGTDVPAFRAGDPGMIEYKPKQGEWPAVLAKRITPDGENPEAYQHAITSQEAWQDDGQFTPGETIVGPESLRNDG